MSPPWFYLNAGEWTTSALTLSSDESHHVARVLRLRAGDAVVVTDGAGRVARGEISRIEGRVTVEVSEIIEERRPQPEIVIYQGAAKAGKLDDLVERLAGLGVAELRAFVSERTVARWDEDKVRNLGERWQARARAAGKQSRNPFFLDASAGLTWDGLLEAIAGEPLAITLWEQASLPLRTLLIGGAARVAVVIGPEGGFTPDEAEALATAGAPAASLGPRILRTENAPLVAASALLYHYGLLG
jgi:16S rRNA (uracil1498-N3)-methyltransferase